MAKYIRRTPEYILGNLRSYYNSLSKAHFRRAERLGIAREFVDLAEVALACGRHCHICDQPIYVEPWLNPGRRNEFHFDHVVSLADGGTHTFGNIRLAHRWCNLNKEIQRRKGAQ